MKKLFATFICAAVMLVAGVPVYAAENENVPDTAITSGTAEGAEGAIFVEQAAMPPAKLPIVELQPIQVKMEMVGDTPYITKVYELDRTGDLTLMVNGFEQDGYIFTRHDIYEQMQADVVDTRQASQSATVEIADNSTAAVLAAADAVISFSEDGYSGQLQIDANSIHIEEAGRTSYNYRITEVREYANLDRNDANYIPKTITKDGRTLELESIDWQVMGTTNTDGGLVPNNFKATATYAGSATGSQVSGYVATFQYTGLIEKTTQGKCLYSLRHTSTSYKLRISNGDIKSVQGDTGHATAQMVTDTYADIIDEDRKYNAQHFEEHFFQDDRPTEMTQQTEAAQKRSMELTPAELLNFMALVQQNPDAIRQVMTVAGATA